MFPKYFFKFVFLPFIHTSFIRMWSSGLERQVGIKSYDSFVNIVENLHLPFGWVILSFKVEM